MPEPRDELDTWLSVQVEPLLPPPGTFERVSTRARRLRARRAVLAAAGALAVVADRRRRGSPAGDPRPGDRPPGERHRRAVQCRRRAAAPGHRGGRLHAGPGHGRAAGPGVAPAPPPLSVTFVGAATGWVMGQSLPAGQCDQPAAPACIVLRRTDSGGATWRTVHAPPAHGPNGPTGVSQIRFLTRSDGWAFGPQLWATHNAGRTWTQIATGGLRVTALEARAGGCSRSGRAAPGPGPASRRAAPASPSTPAPQAATPGHRRSPRQWPPPARPAAPLRCC